MSAEQSYSISPAPTMPPPPSLSRAIVREALTYTASYCEENIYLILRDHVEPSQVNQYTVVWISNPQQCVPLFFQRISQGNLPICWDYHVILLHTSPTTKLTTVYDFDTQLSPFPLTFRDYFLPTLNGPSPWPAWPTEIVEAIQETIAKNPRRYKLVKGNDYIRLFASSRRHMLKNVIIPMSDRVSRGAGVVKDTGSGMVKEVEIYASPPPTYSPIKTEESECTFRMFVDFSSSWSDCEYGRIVDEWAFLREFLDS